MQRLTSRVPLGPNTLSGVAPHHPSGVDHVGQPDGVVRMQVGQEEDADLAQSQRRHPRAGGLFRPAHHAGSGVD